MKRYKYDVYENDGTYITTWNDVISEPNFSMSLNSGLSEMTVQLARLADDFGESDDIAFRNQVIVRCFDKDNNDGQIIYNGFISTYTPGVDGNNEIIEVILLGYVKELSQIELLDNGSGINDSPTLGNTRVVYTGQEPGDILKDIIDKYNDIDGVVGKINYSLTSIQDTAITIDYEFNTIMIMDAINKLVEMCPADWYWYLDENNIINLKQFAEEPEHVFFVGKDIEQLKPSKRVENIKNVCYVIGKEVAGENLFRVYDRSASIASYGRSAVFITDNRLTDVDTMQKFADAQLDLNDEPEVRTQANILDNNNEESEKGYDIETVKPGNIAKILNYLSKKTYTLWGQALWGVDKWGYDIANVTATNTYISKVSYTPEKISLELSSRLPFFTRSVNELRRRLDLVSTEKNPDAPTA